MQIFNELFFKPIFNLLVVILRGLEFVGVPGALGLAIIILTIIIRMLIWPFMATQLKSARKMADLKPHLDVLKKKHKDNKQDLASAQMALYKEHGVNPAGGCLPALIQFPIIIALYQSISVLFDFSKGMDYVNSWIYSPSWFFDKFPDPGFLGLNLASKPSDYATAGMVVLSVPIITALLQFMQSKMMLPPATVKEYPTDSKKEKKEKEEAQDTMSAVQSQMTYLMPIMIGYFSWTFPIGLAVYWNAFTILGMVQQYRISGWGGMEGWVKKVRG